MIHRWERFEGDDPTVPLVLLPECVGGPLDGDIVEVPADHSPGFWVAAIEEVGGEILFDSIALHAIWSEDFLGCYLLFRGEDSLSWEPNRKSFDRRNLPEAA